MPYEMPSNNILPGILSVMAAIKQGKIAKQQRDQDMQYKQQQIQNMRATEQRTAHQDAINNVLNGIGPDGKPIPIPPQYIPGASDDLQTRSTKLIAAAAYLDSKGARNLANAYRQTAMTGAQIPYEFSGVPLRQAQTGLTQAKTTTEQQRPALVKAQTQYTKAGVPLRNAQTQRITTIQPQQFQEQIQQRATEAAQRIAAAQERAANAQAAAWERLLAHFGFEDTQRQKREGYSRQQAAQRNAHAQNERTLSGQAETLRSTVLKLMQRKDTNGNPDPPSVDQIRDAARQDGFSDEVINMVLPRTPAERDFKRKTPKGTSYGWGP